MPASASRKRAKCRHIKSGLRSETLPLSKLEPVLTNTEPLQRLFVVVVGGSGGGGEREEKKKEKKKKAGTQLSPSKREREREKEKRKKRKCLTARSYIGWNHGNV